MYFGVRFVLRLMMGVKKRIVKERLVFEEEAFVEFVIWCEGLWVGWVEIGVSWGGICFVEFLIGY